MHRCSQRIKQRFDATNLANFGKSSYYFILKHSFNICKHLTFTCHLIVALSK